MANIEELTQEDIDRMEESIAKLEQATEKYKKENQKFRTERDEFKAAADNNEVNAKLRERVLQAEARAKLTATGAKDADRFAKYVDFSKVAFDDEGGITGLDDQIEVIKTDFAEVFDPKKRVGGMADAGEKNPVATGSKNPVDIQLDALLGSR